MRHVFPIALLAVLTAIPCVTAAQLAWTPTNGPEGGLVASMTVDSAHRLFAATAFGGVFESNDQGGHWFPRNTDLPTFHMKQIESSTSGFIYAAAYNAGLFRYHNDDRPRWEALAATTAYGTFSGLATTPNSHVFGSVALVGVLRSTDDGVTWTNTSRGMLTAADSDIRIVTSNPSGALAAASATGTVFLSTNDGLDWAKLLPTPSTNRSSALMLDPHGGIFYGDDHGNLYRTLDTGQHWTRAFQTLYHAGVLSLATSKHGGHMFLWDHDGYLYRSVDRGASWTVLDSIPTGGDYFSMAIDSDGSIYTGTDFEGVFQSKDDGATKEHVNTQLIANLTVDVVADSKGNIFTVSEDFIFRSTDRGNTWDRLNFEIGESLAPATLAVDSADHLYIGTPNGVFASFDGGSTWLQQVKPVTPSTTNLCRSIGVDPAGYVYAATQSGIQLSYDQGHNFKIPGVPPKSEPFSTIVIGGDSNVYAVNDQGHVFVGSNLGFFWTDIGIAPGLVAVDAHGVMYAISNREISRSRDTAKTWETLRPRDTAGTSGVFDVFIDRAQHVFAATDSGIYQLNADGETWTLAGNGLKDPSATRLSSVTKMCEDRFGHYYAASRGQGVFRSNPQSSVTTGRVGRVVSVSNYPNPFHTSTIIQLDLEKAANTTIAIYDATGRKVEDRDLGILPEGPQNVSIAGEELPSGAYYYRILTGSQTFIGHWLIVRE